MVVVVGAGVAGLACARELERRSVPAVTLERARSVGGRCATRRVQGQAVDHGLPFLQARSWEFGKELREAGEDRLIPGWPVRVREPRLAVQADAYKPGLRRMAHRDGVSAFARHLARGLDVRLGHRVERLSATSGRITAHLRGGRRLAAPLLVLAGALPESLALAEPMVRDWPGAEEKLARLRAVRVLPTVTVIAGYPPETPEPPFDAWHPIEATMLGSIFHDSTKRRAPRWRVLVLHGRTAFSEAALDRKPEEWSRELVWEAGELLGEWAASPAWTQTYVWRAGQVRSGDQLNGPVAFESDGGARVMLAGDAFAADPGLEGAYLSGIAVGEQIAVHPEVKKRIGRRVAG